MVNKSTEYEIGGTSPSFKAQDRFLEIADRFIPEKLQQRIAAAKEALAKNDGNEALRILAEEAIPEEENQESETASSGSRSDRIRESIRSASETQRVLNDGEESEGTSTTISSIRDRIDLERSISQENPEDTSALERQAVHETLSREQIVEFTQYEILLNDRISRAHESYDKLFESLTPISKERVKRYREQLSKDLTAKGIEDPEGYIDYVLTLDNELRISLEEPTTGTAAENAEDWNYSLRPHSAEESFNRFFTEIGRKADVEKAEIVNKIGDINETMKRLVKLGRYVGPFGADQDVLEDIVAISSMDGKQFENFEQFCQRYAYVLIPGGQTTSEYDRGSTNPMVDLKETLSWYLANQGNLEAFTEQLENMRDIWLLADDAYIYQSRYGDREGRITNFTYSDLTEKKEVIRNLATVYQSMEAAGSYLSSFDKKNMYDTLSTLSSNGDLDILVELLEAGNKYPGSSTGFSAERVP